MLRIDDDMPRKPVDSIDITAELAERPHRAPDHAGENAALAELAAAMTSAPDTVLDRLAQAAMRLTGAASAGISLLEPGGRYGQFRWVATAGALDAAEGSLLPREDSPCGEVIARGTTLLLRDPGRVYQTEAPSPVPVSEALLSPFEFENRPIGTVWAMHDDPTRRFDGEDARLLASLARFASVAHQVVVSLNRAHRQSLALKASRDRVQATLDASMDMIQLFEAVRDDSGAIVDFRWVLNNRTADAYYGEDMVGRRLLDCNPGVIAEGIFEAFCRVVETGVPDRSERRYRHEQFDGWFYQSAVKLGDGVATTTTDITELKRAEHQVAELRDAIAAARLDQSEQRFRGLVEGHAQAVWETDPAGVVVADSPSWRAYTGQSREAWLGYGWLDAIHPDDRSYAERQWREAMHVGKFNAEFRLWSAAEGRWRWTNVRAVPLIARDGAILKWVGMNIDVDERRRAEEILRDSQERQAFLLRLSDGLASIADATDLLRYAARLLGEQMAVDRTFYSEIDGPAGARTAVIRAQHVRRGAALPDRVDYDRRAGGWISDWLRRGERVVIADVAGDPRLDERSRAALIASGARAMILVSLLRDGEETVNFGVQHGAPRSWTAADIQLVNEVAERTWAAAARVRTESALAKSEERLRSAVEVGQVGLWDWDVTTGAIHWSDEHFRMEGYAVGEVTPSYQTWSQRLHPDDRAATEAALHHAMTSGEEYVHEFRVVHPDGTVRWMAARGQFVYDAAGAAVRMVGAMVDTTERRDLENRQTALVGELQHRTRNLMGVIRSIAHKAMDASRDLADFHARFEDRMTALSRVHGLLSRLGEHDRIGFDQLIRGEMEAMSGDPARVTLDGPAGIRLRSSTVQMLALALHELATNAVKYGALGQPGARLTIRWHWTPPEADGRPWLTIDWREQGVTMPPPGQGGAGQGRDLIERALPYQLDADTRFTLTADGVHCIIALPVSETTAV
ncbi:PAS domain-containing protein [Sphingomonas sp. XXL09]|uniref:PAS domain-containing protein n=1 Tax=Sphingomonas sp. XXL09 TaxID=3457787 RepID=UPI00406BB2BB